MDDYINGLSSRLLDDCNIYYVFYVVDCWIQVLGVKYLPVMLEIDKLLTTIKYKQNLVFQVLDKNDSLISNIYTNQ